MQKFGSHMTTLSTHSFPENLAICGTFPKISVPRDKWVWVFFFENFRVVKNVHYWLLYIPDCTERPGKKTTKPKQIKSTVGFSFWWFLVGWFLLSVLCFGFCFWGFFFLISWILSLVHDLQWLHKKYNIQIITQLSSWRQLHLLL